MTGPSPTELLAYLLAQYDRAVQVIEHINMDKPEDIELHAQVVAQLKQCAVPVREALIAWDLRELLTVCWCLLEPHPECPVHRYREDNPFS